MTKKKINSGFKKSKLDGTEYIYSSTIATIPEKYSYKKYLPKVLNQGLDPICIPCSISAYINLILNSKTGKKEDNKIAYFDIYNSKTIEGEGMTFKEAFSYLKHNGVKTKNCIFKIHTYSMIKSSLALKSAIIMNGPCFGALPVYNDTNDFWIKRNGDTLLGYHAIAIVGYDPNGFIIRNSWGESYGDEKGYHHIKTEDFNKFIELWTIVN